MFAAGNLLPRRFCFFFSEDKKFFSESVFFFSEFIFARQSFVAGKRHDDIVSLHNCPNIPQNVWFLFADMCQ